MGTVKGYDAFIGSVSCQDSSGLIDNRVMVFNPDIGGQSFCGTRAVTRCKYDRQKKADNGMDLYAGHFLLLHPLDV